MELWQLDIVYGPRLIDAVSGKLREGRIVTGVDDHSRYCVLARAVERATGRAVCLAHAEALARYGAPEEVLADSGNAGLSLDLPASLKAASIGSIASRDKEGAVHRAAAPCRLSSRLGRGA
jgi:hypothetical protein